MGWARQSGLVCLAGWLADCWVLHSFANPCMAHILHTGTAGGRLEISVSDPIKHNEGALQAYIAFKVRLTVCI